MNKYILFTENESGDRFVYGIETDKKLDDSSTELDDFLSIYGTDIEDGYCYEHITHFMDLNKINYINI